MVSHDRGEAGYCAPAAVAEHWPAIQRHDPADDGTHVTVGGGKANAGRLHIVDCQILQKQRHKPQG